MAGGGRALRRALTHTTATSATVRIAAGAISQAAPLMRAAAEVNRLPASRGASSGTAQQAAQAAAIRAAILGTFDTDLVLLTVAIERRPCQV